jgi:hypothetical protein
MVARVLFGVSFVVLLTTLSSLSEHLIGGAFAEAASWLPWLLGSGFAAALSHWLLRRRELVVGIDGLRLDGLLRKRFIPFHEVERVRDEGDETLIDRKKGWDLRLVKEPDGGGLTEVLSRTIEARDEALSRPAELLEDLRRGERSAKAWGESIAKLTRGSYRDKRLRVADLEAVVDNPTADPEQRVAAAVALSPDDEARARIRVAADGLADIDMRAALEAAAEGEIALRRLERAKRRLAEED